MSNRKDQKGRILKKGESQRKDGRYQYRYTDKKGKRHTVYAGDLRQLRQKEAEIERSFYIKQDYASGRITVGELLDRAFRLNNRIRPSTQERYASQIERIKSFDFASMPVQSVKYSDAKQWMIELSQFYSYGSISNIKVRLYTAFQMAVQDDILVKNPMDFRLSDVLVNDSKKRDALTPEQTEQWLSFLQQDTIGKRYYDVTVILLETGLRISELCGLTKQDVDFAQRHISINHQLLMIHGKLGIFPPKTKSGVRTIPLSEKAAAAFAHVLEQRPKLKTEWIVDGYSQFFFLQKDGKPKVGGRFQAAFHTLVERHNRLNPTAPLPYITPHMLRHTFCTRQVQAGINPKALQYLMDHANVDLTLNWYAHVGQSYAEEEFWRVQKEKNA